MADLEVALPDAEVLFGPSFAHAFDDLRSLVHELGLNVRYHAEGISDHTKARAFGDQWKSIGRIAIASGSPDEFGERLNSVVARIEEIVRPYV